MFVSYCDVLKVLFFKAYSLTVFPVDVCISCQQLGLKLFVDKINIYPMATQSVNVLEDAPSAHHNNQLTLFLHSLAPYEKTTSVMCRKYTSNE